MQVRVKVTEENIRSSARCDTRYCPVSIAVGNAIGKEVRRVQTDCADIRVWTRQADPWLPSSADLIAATPEEVEAFIKRYDRRDPVEPFEFDLTFRKQMTFRRPGKGGAK